MLPDSVRTAEKLLYFVDSLQCSTCQISKFVRFGEIMRKADSTGRFELMFLVSPKKGEKEFIRDYIKSIEMPFPICVDLDNAFKRINPAIPDDVRFHCLYLDAEGRPLLAGDPTVSENISALLDKIIFNNPTNRQQLSSQAQSCSPSAALPWPEVSTETRAARYSRTMSKPWPTEKVAFTGFVVKRILTHVQEDVRLVIN